MDLNFGTTTFICYIKVIFKQNSFPVNVCPFAKIGFYTPFSYRVDAKQPPFQIQFWI